MKKLFMFVSFICLCFALTSCTTVKKLGCNQIDSIAESTGNGLAKILVCKRADLIKQDLGEKLEGILKCEADAGIASKICEVAVEQAIYLIPAEDYTKYECSVKEIAIKVKPLAQKACALIP